MDRINQNLRYLRVSAGKTKKWIADKLERSSTVIAHYETGKIIPPVEVIRMYANLFDVKPGDIIDRDLESDGLSVQTVEEPAVKYGARSRIQREKDLLHKELDLRLEEIRILHESIRQKPAALAELKALDPELYEELEKMFPRGE